MTDLLLGQVCFRFLLKGRYIWHGEINVDQDNIQGSAPAHLLKNLSLLSVKVGAL